MSCGGSSRGFLVTPQTHLKTPGTNPIVQGESISRHIENEHAYETKCDEMYHCLPPLHSTSVLYIVLTWYKTTFQSRVFPCGKVNIEGVYELLEEKKTRYSVLSILHRSDTSTCVSLRSSFHHQS